MTFDFDAAVVAPFRMQPGLRRLAPGAAQLTPLRPGSKHQREKLAVLTAYWPQALVAVPGHDAAPALAALADHAAAVDPEGWAIDAGGVSALRLGARVAVDGAVRTLSAGAFGLGDEVARCLAGLPPPWRLTGLLSLAHAEDFALVDGDDATVPWIAAALPSHWAPERTVGHRIDAIHAPVADGSTLRDAAAALAALVTGGDRWERFVWTVTDWPRLHAHPDRTPDRRWDGTAVADAWWRTERQTFMPLAGTRQAVFTIAVDIRRLADAIDTPARAAALHAAVASMSSAVLRYRGLDPVRDALLDWLAVRS